MKCLPCGHDAKRSERTDGKCPQCKHPFAFEPAEDKITDLAFQAVIDDVSAKGTLQYTQAQLYLATSRRLGPKLAGVDGVGCVGFIGVAAAFAATLATASEGKGLLALALLLVTCALAGVMITYRARSKGRVRLDWPTFHPLLDKWTRAHGAPKGLLAAEASRVKRLTDAQRQELSHYSFDRLLVVERDPVAVMLVRNHFHFENNCAILSLEGYPGDETRAMVLAMAHQNPALRVFVAHDASSAGCAALSYLRRKEWLRDPQAPVADLGLRPSQVWSLRRPAVAGEGEPTVGLAEALTWLTPKERAWLDAGHWMSLEAMGPAALMRALHQGFARAQMLAAPDDGAIVAADVGSDVAIWSGSGSFDQFASDSFG